MSAVARLRQRVAALLKAVDKSPADLARFVKRDHSWASRFLVIGDRSVPITTAERIAEFLGVEIEDLFHKEHDDVSTRLSVDEYRLIHEWRRLTDDRRALIRRLLDELPPQKRPARKRRDDMETDKEPTS